MFEGIITLNATTGELKEFNAFRLLFDSTAVLDTVLQCYNFAVLFIATPKAMVDYRYYLCMQIISDLIFEIWYGYILAPRVTPVSNCFITRGPLVLTTETSSRFAAGFLFFSVGLVICAQHYSYLYRLALFKFGHDFYTIQEKLNRPLEVKKLLPNAKNVLLCTGVSSGNLAWFVIIFILLLTSQLINIIGGILIIKEIKSAAVLMKQENYKLNLQLSTVLLIQVSRLKNSRQLTFN
ncbi:hypothetical protein DdX_16687 [Ditylenchus destructor]|uniref:Uncharacterized protein n=1 Tax=Ditylenchus destructor TaxID=166010 RepID=A0AAD4QWG8_9BILA|nr:hypothetical protein DdX_16687 [Ditylenchus destructor]